MVGRAVLTTEMSRTTRIWAARATASRAQDFLGACSSGCGVRCGCRVVRRGGTSELLGSGRAGSVGWLRVGCGHARQGRAGADRGDDLGDGARPTRPRARSSVDQTRVGGVDVRCRWLSTAPRACPGRRPSRLRASDSEVVRTASGRSCSVVRAWAWREDRRDHRRSRPARSGRRVRWRSSPGRWPTASAGQVCAGAEQPSRDRAGPAWAAGPGRDASRRTDRRSWGCLVICSGLELSSSTMPATCSGYCAA